MIKAKGYYSEAIDYDYYDRLNIDPPEAEIVETVCYIEDKGIQPIFDTQDGKLIIYYDNGFDTVIKNEADVLKKLIS